jgi:hypothetical protein
LTDFVESELNVEVILDRSDDDNVGERVPVFDCSGAGLGGDYEIRLIKNITEDCLEFCEQRVISSHVDSDVKYNPSFY